MDIRPEYRKKSIRSYVVRAGRMTDGQRSAFENSWPQYGLKLADGPIDTDRLFGRSGSKVLEIGFGMGDSLLKMAAAEPETDFIGIEVHPPGVGTLINGLYDSYGIPCECCGIPCDSYGMPNDSCGSPWHSYGSP